MSKIDFKGKSSQLNHVPYSLWELEYMVCVKTDTGSSVSCRVKYYLGPNRHTAYIIHGFGSCVTTEKQL